MIIVYKATNTITKKAYVGITESDLDIRKEQHFRDSRQGSATHFHRALRKYTPSDWKWIILDECATREIAGETEIQKILEHKTFTNGYNSTTGGEFGYTLSDDVRMKRAAPKSRETKRRMSSAHTGKFVTQATRKKMSLSHIGKPQGPRTKEQIQKQADSHRGTKHGPMSEETKRKLSAAKMGVPQKIVGCSHCNKTGGLAIMKRWHFDNCKAKP